MDKENDQELDIIVEEGVKNITNGEYRKRQTHTVNHHREYVSKKYLDALEADKYFDHADPGKRFFDPENRNLKIVKFLEMGIVNKSSEEKKTKVLYSNFTRDDVFFTVNKYLEFKVSDKNKKKSLGTSLKVVFMLPNGNVYSIMEFYHKILEGKSYDVEKWGWGGDEITRRLHHLGFPVFNRTKYTGN